jgi:hypothetical protein
MLVYLGLDELLMMVEFVFNAFELFLFLQFQYRDPILQLAEVSVGLVKLVPHFPVRK